jgi:sec-independent protein translocase protein TatC
MLSHFLELRRRIVHVLIIFSVFFLGLFLFAPQLFQVFMLPVFRALPAENALIATQIITPLVVSVKLTLDAAILFTAPFALWHIWRFVSPGLYQQERRWIGRATIASIVLFLIGILSGFYLLIPCLLTFFIRAVPVNVQLMPDMAYAVDFITRMLLISGLSFQIPLVCALLVHLHLVDVTTLKRIRPYVIVFAFVLGMLFTPPDALSQVMLAVPLCVLYEVGIVLSGIGRNNVL